MKHINNPVFQVILTDLITCSESTFEHFPYFLQTGSWWPTSNPLKGAATLHGRQQIPRVRTGLTFRCGLTSRGENLVQFGLPWLSRGDFGPPILSCCHSAKMTWPLLPFSWDAYRVGFHGMKVWDWTGDLHLSQFSGNFLHTIAATTRHELQYVAVNLLSWYVIIIRCHQAKGRTVFSHSTTSTLWQHRRSCCCGLRRLCVQSVSIKALCGKNTSLTFWSLRLLFSAGLAVIASPVTTRTNVYQNSYTPIQSIRLLISQQFWGVFAAASSTSFAQKCHQSSDWKIALLQQSPPHCNSAKRSKGVFITEVPSGSNLSIASLWRILLYIWLLLSFVTFPLTTSLEMATRQTYKLEVRGALLLPEDQDLFAYVWKGWYAACASDNGLINQWKHFNMKLGQHEVSSLEVWESCSSLWQCRMQVLQSISSSTKTNLFNHKTNGKVQALARRHCALT